MRRPKVLNVCWEDHRYMIRDESGRLVAGTQGTFLCDRASQVLFASIGDSLKKAS